MPTKASTPSKVSVDFSDVAERREGGKSAHVPTGDYLLRVEGCELKHKNDDETSKYLNWRCSIVEPAKYRNAGSIWHVTSLRKEALWNLRNFLEDLGFKVPKRAVDVPVAKIVAAHTIFGATIVDDDYEKNGKTIVRSKIDSTFKKDAFEGASEEEEEESTATTDEEDDEEVEEETDEIDLDEDL